MVEITPEIRQQLRDEWLGALESGEFKQAQRRLETPNGYCCLGVACVIYERVTGETLPRNDNGFLAGILPMAEVLNAFGMKDKTGEVGGTVKIDTGDDYTLTGCNDNLGWDFKQIAKAVRDAGEGFWRE